MNCMATAHSGLHTEINKKRLRCTLHTLLLSLVLVLPATAPAAAQGDSPAQDEVRQVLVPREVFVGDRAELRCTFQSQMDFAALADPSLVKDGAIQLNTHADAFTRHAGDYTVELAVLQQAGTTCTLIITFVPWKTGQLHFEACDLPALCGAAEHAEPFLIHFSPVEISSLTEKLSVSAVRPPAPPLLLPGTSYALWICIVVFLLLLVATGILLAKFSALVRCATAVRESAGYYWNARSARSKLFALGRKKSTDVQFAEQWQATMRAYLAYRFGVPFSSATAKGIAPLIRRVTGNMLDIEQENAVSSLTSLFIRTDYIRFAGGSIDSRMLPAAEHEAVFTPGERNSIIALSCQVIAALESSAKEGVPV